MQCEFLQDSPMQVGEAENRRSAVTASGPTHCGPDGSPDPGPRPQRTCSVSPENSMPSPGTTTALRVPSLRTRPAIHAS